MPFQPGNNFGTLSKGGGRKNKKDEELRELLVQKAIGKYVKALRSLDSLNDKQIERIARLVMPVVVKDMANKIGNPDGSKLVFTPIYGAISRHKVDTKDIPTNEEDKGDLGGNQCQ